MPDLPAHPDFSAGDAPPPDPDSTPPGARRLRTMIVVLVVALLAAIIALHVAGVLGPGTNG